MNVEEINKVYECCKDSFHRHCDGCPVTDDCFHDKMPLFVLKYAIELLEDEEELGEELGNAVELIRKKDERIKKLLKELDFYKNHEHEVCANCPLDERNAVKPKRGRAWTQKAWFCGKCDFRLNMAGSFCAKCGMPVNWETADT